MRKRPRTTAKQVQPKAPAEKLQLGPWQCWILAAAIPIILCAMRLNLDLWYDEAYTIFAFVSRPWLEIVTDYSAPNNHIFYSLLLHPVYLVSGDDFVLRFPSFLFAVGTFLLVFRLVRRWVGIPAAVVSTLVLGLTQMFLIHAIEVRGYGLSMLLAAWLGDLALPPAQHRRWLRGVAIVLVGAALVYTVPTNAFFLAAIAVGAAGRSLLVERRLSALGREVAVWVAAAVVALALYLPVWSQLRQAAFDRPGASFAAIWDLVRSTYWAALRDWVPALVPAVFGAGFLFRDAVAGKRSERWAFALLIAAVLVLPFVFAGLLQMVPFPRNYCPMLPFLAMALGCTVLRAIDGVGQLASARWPPAASVAIAALLLLVVALPQVFTYPARLAEVRRQEPRIQDGYFNYYAARFEPSAVIEYLRSVIDPRSSYSILVADGDYYCLAYYCRQLGMPLSNMTASGLAQGLSVYMIAPEVPNYESISARSGIPVEVLRRFTVLERFGYYRLYALTALPRGRSGAVPGGSAGGAKRQQR